MMSQTARGGQDKRPSVLVLHDRLEAARQSSEMAADIQGQALRVLPVALTTEDAADAGVRGLSARRWDPRVVFKLAALLRKEQASVLHCMPATEVFGAIAAKIARTPAVIMEGPLSCQIGWMTRRSLRSATAVVVRSEQAARRLIVEGVRSSRINVIWEALPDRHVETSLHERQEVRQRHGVLDESWLIGIQAGGSDDGCFLQAASIVRAEVPGTKFMMTGLAAMHADLQRRAAVLGLNGSVIFAGAQPNPAQYAGAMDVAVVAEGASRFAIQAMGLGRPLVALDRGQHADLFPMGEAGLLVPPGNPLILAHAILELMRHPEAVERMRRRGREMFVERHSMTRMVSAYRELYLDLCREQPTSEVVTDAAADSQTS